MTLTSKCKACGRTMNGLASTFDYCDYCTGLLPIDTVTPEWNTKADPIRDPRFLELTWNWCIDTLQTDKYKPYRDMWE